MVLRRMLFDTWDAVDEWNKKPSDDERSTNFRGLSGKRVVTVYWQRSTTSYFAETNAIEYLSPTISRVQWLA
jgi:hypothetical protein